jgi:Holliday junction resolvase RusA-like endonuclease
VEDLQYEPPDGGVRRMGTAQSAVLTFLDSHPLSTTTDIVKGTGLVRGSVKPALSRLRGRGQVLRLHERPARWSVVTHTTIQQALFPLYEPETTILQLIIEGEPITKSRARATTTGGLVKFYTPTKTRQAHQRLAWEFSQAFQHRQPLDSCDLGVELRFSCGTAKRQDLDNLVKLVFDAANRVIWYDDSQVVDLKATMLRSSSHPHTAVRIWVVRDLRRACLVCGVIFLPRPGRPAHVYCSLDCTRRVQQRGRYVACATCGTRIYRQREKLAAYSNHYCSEGCKTAAQTGRPRQITRQIDPIPPTARACPVCQTIFSSRSLTCSIPCGTIRRELRRKGIRLTEAHTPLALPAVTDIPDALGEAPTTEQ